MKIINKNSLMLLLIITALDCSFYVFAAKDNNTTSQTGVISSLLDVSNINTNQVQFSDTVSDIMDLSKVTADGATGLMNGDSFLFINITPQTVTITSPLDASYINTNQVQVSGTVSDIMFLSNVTVNGVKAFMNGDSFYAVVPLIEGNNVVVAEANYLFNNEVTTSISVIVDTESPALISAISVSNIEVLLQFSESVQGGQNGAENLNAYSIKTVDTNSNLTVWDVNFWSLEPDTSTILLSTYSQASSNYKLTVSGIKDLAGNPIARPTIQVDHSSTFFVGTDPSGDTIVDTDGDGIHDHIELIGWEVIVKRTDGGEEVRNVTSDPRLADTDADGVDDNEERNGSMDPRNSDTDGDLLSDNQEWNTVYSDPTSQDTDGDGLNDGTEFNFFRTSPLFADTDGDQFDDFDEVAVGNRDALLSDLPSPRIRIGSVNLQLDTRFSFTNETGEQVSEDKTVETTLTRGEDETFSTSNENSTINTLQFSEQLESSVSFEPGPDGGLGGSVTATVGSTQGSERGSTFTKDESSGRSSEEAYHDSLTTTTARDIRESITREIIDAALKVDLTIENDNDVPFSIGNLELTAQTQNPLNRRNIIPIASMVPENEALDFVNIGALGDPSRGPFVFKTISVFPQQVQELMKNPRGLVVQLANFDITDEFGRNFAFVSQEVLDRTAGITFDMGDGRTESYRVATSSAHDPNTGTPLGISMEYALSIINLSRYEAIRDGGNGLVETQAVGDDVQVVPVFDSIEPGEVIITVGENGVIDSIDGGDDVVAAPDYDIPIQAATIRDGGNGIAESIANTDVDTQVIDLGETVVPGQVIVHAGNQTNANIDLSSPALGDDIKVGHHRVLTRFRDVKLNTDEKSFWILYTSGNTLGIDLDKLVLRSGEQYDFAFVQDKDDDSVWAREEFLHGSSDLLINTDGCNLNPAPDPCDTLTDPQEIQQGWRVQIKGSPQANLVYPNPVQGDSDRDRLVDHVEKACALDPRQRDTDLDGLTDWEELNGKLLEGGDINGTMVSRDPDTDLILHTIIPYDGFASGLIPHDAIAACNNLSFNGFATDPLNPDTDGDLVTDSLELQLGINPNDPTDGPLFLDDDGDGVPNKIEQDGFFATVNGVKLSKVFTSNPNNPDTDDDGLPDLLEHFIGSNPVDNDTDGDGLTDTNEYQGNGNACVTRNVGEKCVAFKDLVENNFQTFLAECDTAEVCSNAEIEQFLVDVGSAQYGTNLNEKDSDFDTVDDLLELTELVLTVNGENLTVVAPSSNPLDSDTDNDGLSDGEEVEPGADGFITNPRIADTDDDGVNDAREKALGTDPTNQDKKVTFAYSSIVGHETCGDPGNEMEMQGTWKIGNTVVVDMQGDGCPINENGTDNVITRSPQKTDCTVTDNAKKTVVMKPGDSVTMTTKGNDFEECDGEVVGSNCEQGGDEDELSPDVDETFSFSTVNSTTKSIEHFDGDNLCLTTTIKVTVAK